MAEDRSDKFLFEADEVVYLSSCVSCVHKILGASTCAAFPDGIPDEILEGKHAHKSAYRGDNGIQYEAIKDRPHV